MEGKVWVEDENEREDVVVRKWEMGFGEQWE